jgi:hypothetical protein
MTELSYRTPSKRRSWLRSLLFLSGACPFLLVAIGCIAYSATLLSPGALPPRNLDLPTQLLINAAFTAVCLAFAWPFLGWANPYRTLPRPRSGESRPTFTRLSLIAFALALISIAAAEYAYPLCGLLLRLHYFHPVLPIAASRILVLILALLPLAAGTIALIDILTATASPLRRRGYPFDCLSLILAALWLPLCGSTMATDQARARAALADRQRAVETIRLSIVMSTDPSSSIDYLVPKLPPLTEVYEDLAGRSLPPTLIRALRRKPLPAVPLLWPDPATGTLQYAHEGILVLFAGYHVEVILPAYWPKTWAAHNAARAALHLPPQPDPLLPAADHSENLSPLTPE